MQQSFLFLKKREWEGENKITEKMKLKIKFVLVF